MHVYTAGVPGFYFKEKNMSKSPRELLEWAKKENIEFVDVRFTDILGTMHHFTMPLHSIDEEAFTFGIGFDGSSIRGWKAINESDMLVRLDPATAYVDPFFQQLNDSTFSIKVMNCPSQRFCQKNYQNNQIDET